jgi:hypothetical protein
LKTARLALSVLFENVVRCNLKPELDVGLAVRISVVFSIGW